MHRNFGIQKTPQLLKQKTKEQFKANPSRTRALRPRGTLLAQILSYARTCVPVRFSEGEIASVHALDRYVARISVRAYTLVYEASQPDPPAGAESARTREAHTSATLAGSSEQSVSALEAERRPAPTTSRPLSGQTIMPSTTNNKPALRPSKAGGPPWLHCIAIGLGLWYGIILGAEALWSWL